MHRGIRRCKIAVSPNKSLEDNGGLAGIRVVVSVLIHFGFRAAAHFAVRAGPALAVCAFNAAGPTRKLIYECISDLAALFQSRC